MGAGASTKNDRYLQLEHATQERADLPVLPWRQKSDIEQDPIQSNGDGMKSASPHQPARIEDQHSLAELNPTDNSAKGPIRRGCEQSSEKICSARADLAIESNRSAATPATPGSKDMRVRRWIVLASWDAESDEHLSVQEGDAIEVLQLKGAWVLCRMNGKEGLVPRKNLKQTQIRAPGSTRDSRGTMSTHSLKMFVDEAPIAIARRESSDLIVDSQESSIIDNKLKNRARDSAPKRESRKAKDVSSLDARDPSSADLSQDWIHKLGSTMTLHTIQNTIRLAHYLMELLTNGYGTASALHMAAWEGSVDAVVALLSGSNSMVKNYHSRQGELTPLHIATLCGHSGVVEYLLQSEVNVDVATVHGLRALHIAAFSGPELAEVLLDGKAHVDTLTLDEDTPLHIASSYNQIGTAEALLRAGASVGLANNFGVVPLHIMAAHSAMARVPLRDARGVLILSNQSADPAARDKHDRTAHSIAQKAGGDNSLLEFLGATLIKTQKVAAELLGVDDDMVSDNEPTPEHSEDEADTHETALPRFGATSEKREDERTHQSLAAGSNGIQLAGENAALLSEIDKLRKELESSRSNERLLQERLDNAQAAVKSLQITQSQKVLTQESDNQVGQQVRLELEQERTEFLQRQDRLEEERRLWNEEKELLQHDLRIAQDARDTALSEADYLKTERDSMACKVASAADASKVAFETAAETSSRLEAELSEHIAIINQKTAELSASRIEVEKKSTELGVASKTIATQGSELSRLEASNSRLSDELARKGKQFEEAYKSLSDLRTKHSDLEASSQEKALGLECDLRDKCLQIEKLQADNAEQALRLQELDVMQERVDYANRMLKPLENRIQELHDAFAAEQALRKRYHNQLQDAKGAIRVYARIRPVVPREAGQDIAVRKLDAFSMDLDGNDKARKAKTYTFDSIFDDHSSQEDVFLECRSLVSSTIDGFNVTVFAYGQTGAGKTHTMYGNPSQPGLVPRIVEETFSVLGKYSHDCSSHVIISMFELYCNDLVDLLAPKAKGKKVVPPPLEIKKDSRGSVFVENATQREMGSSQELLQCISEGQDRRHVAATKMNADSSRSHLIVILIVESTNKTTKQVTTGKLTLCDLAGSERLKKSEVTGDQKKEAQAINMSLTALGDVIEALSKQAKHIPYRNHKLTQLLSDSIGGNAKTLMFVNCSPVAENGDETHSSLNYAARAKLIVNKVEKNQDSQEVARLKKVVQLMNKELEQVRGSNQTAPPQSFDDQPFLEGDGTEDDQTDT
mmetsp:Transcript_48754/g.75929  ORF Transcript_48754/g.75929 Transcript_48754/m.75929 type:complete len:1265 (-) Transcript_48754:1-3795(-)